LIFLPFLFTYRRGNAKKKNTFNTYFFNIPPKLPPLRKHEAEYTIPEELRLTYIFFILYIYSTSICGNRYSLRQCIVNHVENKVLYSAVLLLAGKHPAKSCKLAAKLQNCQAQTARLHIRGCGPSYRASGLLAFECPLPYTLRN
jgi:hypothetical protein